MYPALTQSNFENPNNFKNYVKSARATKVIVDEQGNIHKGETYWNRAYFDGFVLPAQGQAKPYCKKWVSWGCNNLKQHPKNKHYAEHEQKTCKIAHCPLCFESWINRQANRSTRRFSKFAQNKKFNFRHIVLSPPPERAKHMSYDDLKKWLSQVLKIANIETCAVVFHPFRFQDREKIQPYDSPHFHLIVYGKLTNTTEFYNKTRWLIKNKGDLKKDVDIFNCVRYLLSHAGVRKKTHVIRYLGDISYRKLKVEKEPQNHHCPYCNLPLTIFSINFHAKHRPPPIDYVGLWDSSCFSPVEDIDNDTKIPFYTMNDDPENNIDYSEEQIFSFEELLSIRTNSSVIANHKYELSLLKFKTSISCKTITSFC